MASSGSKLVSIMTTKGTNTNILLTHCWFKCLRGPWQLLRLFTCIRGWSFSQRLLSYFNHKTFISYVVLLRLSVLLYVWTFRRPLNLLRSLAHDFVPTQNRTCPYVLFCTPAAALLGRCNNPCLQISQLAHGLIEFLLFHHLQFSLTDQTRQRQNLVQ
jgi:hypothetical protein